MFLVRVVVEGCYLSTWGTGVVDASIIEKLKNSTLFSGSLRIPPIHVSGLIGPL